MTEMIQRQKLVGEIHRTLAGGMVRVELKPEHYDTAIDFALEIYRSRSANAVEERLAFLELQPDQNQYFLPNEVIEVRQIFRRGATGTASGTGTYFEPFGAAFVNQMTMMGSNSSQMSLATYELSTGFQEMIGTMFGLHIMFKWHPTENRLDIDRHVRAPEQVLLWIYNRRLEERLLVDPYARPWLRRYATAQCKLILAEARGKFASIAGPQGGTTMNSDALIASAQTEIDALMVELTTQVDQNAGYGFLIG